MKLSPSNRRVLEGFQIAGVLLLMGMLFPLFAVPALVMKGVAWIYRKTGR